MCGELVVRGWVRPKENVAEELEVESRVESKSAESGSAASTLLQPLASGRKTSWKKFTIYLI